MDLVILAFLLGNFPSSGGLCPSMWLRRLSECAPCCHVVADEVVRTETATPSPNRGPRAPGKGGSVGAVGQLGLLWGASVPTSDRGLLKPKFRYLPYDENRQLARLLQCHRNRISGSQTAPPSPNQGHLAKGGSWVPWGSWGCFGVLRFRPATVAY